MEEQATLVRIALDVSDHGRRRHLMQTILERLRDDFTLDGVSVFRGIAGMNGQRIIHAADLMHFDVDLPLMIEFCCAPETARAAAAALTDLVPEGHVISWPVTRHLPG